MVVLLLGSGRMLGCAGSDSQGESSLTNGQGGALATGGVAGALNGGRAGVPSTVPAGAQGGSSSAGAFASQSGASAAGNAGQGAAGNAGQGGASPAGGQSGSMGAGTDAGGSGGFVHPGLLIRADDLSRARQKISNLEQPWRDSFQLLSGDSKSSATYQFETPPPIIGRNAASAYAGTRYAAEAAAVAAFQNALLFALNGETPHAEKAVAVLNAYARTTLHFDQSDPERDLEAAILGWLWVSAAELVRYSGYAGWDAEDIQRFDDWIRHVVYDDSAYHPGGVLVTPLVNGAGARGAFGLRTKMAIGIYLNDHVIFDQAVDYFFNGKGNGAPDYYVNPTTGQTWEAGRDQGHAQGGLSRLIECAQMAYTQGDSTLYAWKDGGLQRAVEYIASYNLGNDVPYSSMQPYTLSYAEVYPQISSEGRGSFATIYELPYSHLHGTLGVDLPQTRLAIQQEVVESFSAQNDNPMFATLLYRR